MAKKYENKTHKWVFEENIKTLKSILDSVITFAEMHNYSKSKILRLENALKELKKIKVKF